MYRRRRSSRLRRSLSLAFAVAPTGVLAGCGSSNSSSSRTAASKATTSSAQTGSTSTAVAGAQRVVTLAETKLLCGPTTGPAPRRRNCTRRPLWTSASSRTSAPGPSRSSS
jgi:hypothetical protein